MNFMPRMMKIFEKKSCEGRPGGPGPNAKTTSYPGKYGIFDNLDTGGNENQPAEVELGRWVFCPRGAMRLFGLGPAAAPSASPVWESPGRL